jgi:hypothetical protein
MPPGPTARSAPILWPSRELGNGPSIMKVTDLTLTALAANCGWLAAAGPFEPGKEREWDFLDQAKFRGTLVGMQDDMVQIRMADGVIRDFWPGGAEAISATYLQRSVTRLPTKPATPVLKPGTGPVIDLTASALPDGALRQWKNGGRAGGSFTALNQPPTVGRVQGRKAVVFEHPPWLLPLEFQSMVSDFIVPETVTRSETLTVVAWLCNFGPVVDRETFFCWGEKDCGELDTPDFSYGCYEAMQWYDEKLTMPPARFPKLGQWHQFAYVIRPSDKDRNRLSLELFVDGSRVSGKLVRKPKPQLLDQQPRLSRLCLGGLVGTQLGNPAGTAVHRRDRGPPGLRPGARSCGNPQTQRRHRQSQGDCHSPYRLPTLASRWLPRNPVQSRTPALATPSRCGGAGPAFRHRPRGRRQGNRHPGETQEPYRRGLHRSGPETAETRIRHHLSLARRTGDRWRTSALPCPLVVHHIGFRTGIRRPGFQTVSPQNSHRMAFTAAGWISAAIRSSVRPATTTSICGRRLMPCGNC